MSKSNVEEMTEGELMSWEETSCQYKPFIHSSTNADIIIDTQEELKEVIRDFEKAIKEEGEDVVITGGTIGCWEGKDENNLENVDMIDVESYKDIIRHLKHKYAERWLENERRKKGKSI